MTRNSAGGAVAAALVAALSFGTAAAPAVAMAETNPDEVAIVAQCVSEDEAINAAVDASPVWWYQVQSTQCIYYPMDDVYVVTIRPYVGDWWIVYVKGATGEAHHVE